MRGGWHGSRRITPLTHSLTHRKRIMAPKNKTHNSVNGVLRYIRCYLTDGKTKCWSVNDEEMLVSRVVFRMKLLCLSAIKLFLRGRPAGASTAPIVDVRTISWKIEMGMCCVCVLLPSGSYKSENVSE